MKVTENHHENRMHGIHFGSKHPLHQLLALFHSSRTRPERVTDQEMVKPLLKDVKLKDSLMDGAYDKEEVFKFMKEKGVAMPGIKIRKNAINRADSERAESVLEFKKYGYDSWKIVHGYGSRWAAESVFSAIKRIFGETVRATSTEGMFCEVRRMLAFYTIILSL